MAGDKVAALLHTADLARKASEQQQTGKEQVKWENLGLGGVEHFTGERSQKSMRIFAASLAGTISVLAGFLAFRAGQGMSEYLFSQRVTVEWLGLTLAAAGILTILRSRLRGHKGLSIAPFLSREEAALGPIILERIRSRRGRRIETQHGRAATSLAAPFAVAPPSAVLPGVGLVLALVLLLLQITWMVLTSNRMDSNGLMTWVLGPRVVLTHDLGEALVVRIDAREQWYLNSQAVTPEELPGLLRERLARQPVWVVYVDGDDSIPFGDAARVIDIIRGEHAQAILLTSPSPRHGRP